MAKGRKAQSSRSRTWIYVVAGLAVAGAAMAYFALDRDASSPSGYTPVSGFADVHGMAVNPSNPRELYVATHGGLIRGLDDGGWARVGPTSDDFMGFSMHPTNGSIFWSSGHPGRMTVTERNLGVRISQDGGFTWQRIALEGVDLHAMAVSPANASNLWGWSGGRLWRSTDGGYDWQLLTESAPSLRSLAAHPTEPDTVFAATASGTLRSIDGGTTWKAFAAPANAIVVDPRNPQTMYLAGATLSKSLDAGATWAPTGLSPPGTPGYLAIDPQDPNVVYVVTYETAIHKSSDGGATWTTIKQGSA